MRLALCALFLLVPSVASAQPPALPSTPAVVAPKLSAVPQAPMPRVVTPAPRLVAPVAPPTTPRAPLPAVIAGRVPIAGAVAPSQGSYVNRAFVESSVAARAKFIEQSKASLSAMENELVMAKRDAVTVSAGSTSIRNAVSRDPWQTTRNGGIRLDPAKESSYHAAGQAEYQANQRVRTLEQRVGDLKSRIASDTKAYESAKSELAAHPDVKWFKD